MTKRHTPQILRTPDLSPEVRKIGPRKRTESAASNIESKEAAAAPPLSSLAAVGQIDVEALIERARETVLAQVRTQAEEAKELGRQRGMQEGREQGQLEAKHAFAADIARVRSLADRLGSTLQSQIAGIEDMAVVIAFEALCKILGDNAATTEQIQALVRKATSHVVDAANLVVHLNAADLAILKKSGVLDEVLPNSKVKWRSSEEIELGGCVIATEMGEIDARLEVQIERLREAILTARRSALIADQENKL